MQNKTFAYVGNWGFAPAPKGISIFDYNKTTGEMKLMENIREDIAAGQLCLDAENRILYASDECGDRVGEIGGGGYVYAFRIDPDTGSLELINRQDSLSPEPSFLCMTKSKKYLLACHCADPWHVTKIVRHEDGSYGNEVLFDDTSLVMFPIKEDRSLGAPCDVMVMKNSEQYKRNSRSKFNVDPVSHHIQLVRVISRLHSIYSSPDGRLFITLDKGMDKIITFRVDEEKGKMVKLSEYEVEEVASFPRYGAFHPTLPIFYADNENLTQLNCFRYDDQGRLTLIDRIPLTAYEVRKVHGKPAGCQDIVIAPDGNTLYVSLSGVNEVAVVHLDEEGHPSLIQEVSCRGKFPRCLQFTPEGRYLLIGNMISGDIAEYQIEENGKLKDSGRKFKAVSPSAIRFYETENREE